MVVLFSVSVGIFPELRVIPEVGQSANFPIQWAVWPESGPAITPPPPPIIRKKKLASALLTLKRLLYGTNLMLL